MQARTAGAALVLVCSGVLLSGCLGIAHMQVEAPEVQVTVRGAARAMTVDLVCVDYYAEAASFAALISGSLSSDSRRYDWKRLTVGAADVQTTCRGESRYLGSAVILGVPLGPSRQTARRRLLFVQVAGERRLYRVEVRGRIARVDRTSLDDAERRFPAVLNTPEPALLDPAWAERNRLRHDYYRSASWRSSERIRVRRVEGNRSGAISALVLEVR